MHSWQTSSENLKQWLCAFPSLVGYQYYQARSEVLLLLLLLLLGQPDLADQPTGLKASGLENGGK